MADWLDIILASDGNTDEHRDYIRANGLGGIPYGLSAPLGMTFQVSRLRSRLFSMRQDPGAPAD